MPNAEVPSLVPLTGGRGLRLIRSPADPDLDAIGYLQSEWRASGTAGSLDAPDGLSSDGRWSLVPGPERSFTTRLVLRRPAEDLRCSGTLVVEWLNVSSGTDTAPVFGVAGAEMARAGHVWVGVSAQWAGVVAAPALVDVGDLSDAGGRSGAGMSALQAADPQRYGDLHHPGDAFCFDLFTRVVDALLVGRKSDGSVSGGPLDGLQVDRVLAVGESQSAYALTTYVNGFQPISGRFDGFLIHSRGGPPMALGAMDRGVDLEVGRHDPPCLLRDDLDVPVLVVQTETDVLGHLWSLPARQPDDATHRLWEVAGSAHADRSMVGDFEELLGCDEAINRGQQRFVVRSALRHLDRWVADGVAPPRADPIVVDGDPTAGRSALRFRTDDVGNAVGGVRTPSVDAPAEVLSGLTGPDASHVCRLFGSRRPASPDVLAARYPGGPEDYLSAYAAATDAAIASGFVLADDRDEIISDAHPELIPDREVG